MASKVAIILCVHNNDEFLEGQLSSYRRQRHRDWELLVSEDQATDASRNIIAAFARKGGVTAIIAGPKQGWCRNFLYATQAPAIEHADYFAWSDGDDVWLPEKLTRAVNALSGCRSVPALYCGRTLLVDRRDQPLGFSPLYRKPPAFLNALCQNIAGGNTMVFNRQARALLQAAGEVDVYAHDWWLYLLVSGAGGTVIYDPEPMLRYRQHGKNTAGDGSSPYGRWRSVVRLFAGEYGKRVGRNIDALLRCRQLLSAEHAGAAEMLQKIGTEKSRFRRLELLKLLGVYRQSAWQDKALRMATFAKKFPAG